MVIHFQMSKRAQTDGHTLLDWSTAYRHIGNNWWEWKDMWNGEDDAHISDTYERWVREASRAPEAICTVGAYRLMGPDGQVVRQAGVHPLCNTY